MMDRLPALILVGIGLLAIAGCGGGGGSTATVARSPHAAAGGEKSIEDFGSEATGPGRAALLGAFHAYLEAIAARDYPGACSHLAATVQRSLEQFAAPGSKEAGCEALLPALLAPTAAAISHQQANGHLTKVRVQGDRAFVVFHAPGARRYQLTMVREGGRWKAATLAAAVLVPSAATLGR
jgi:hypothetical protein